MSSRPGASAADELRRPSGQETPPGPRSGHPVTQLPARDPRTPMPPRPVRHKPGTTRGSPGASLAQASGCCPGGIWCPVPSPGRPAGVSAAPPPAEGARPPVSKLGRAFCTHRSRPRGPRPGTGSLRDTAGHAPPSLGISRGCPVRVSPNHTDQATCLQPPVSPQTS